MTVHLKIGMVSLSVSSGSGVWRLLSHFEIGIWFFSRALTSSIVSGRLEPIVSGRMVRTRRATVRLVSPKMMKMLKVSIP